MIVDDITDVVWNDNKAGYNTTDKLRINDKIRTDITDELRIDYKVGDVIMMF